MIHRIKFEHLVELMQSENYQDRFVAEYIQLKQRYEKLKHFNTKIEAATRTQHLDNGVEEPLHDCPAGLLREQQAAMGEYLHLLEVRAVIEHIDLESDIRYYIYKTLDAERECHGFTSCECRTREEIENEASSDTCGDTENTDGLQSASEALPDGVMSLEYTIGLLEAAIHCEEHAGDEACRGPACPLYHNGGCDWGDVESYVSALYHLKRYAETK